MRYVVKDEMMNQTIEPRSDRPNIGYVSILCRVWPARNRNRERRITANSRQREIKGREECPGGHHLGLLDDSSFTFRSLVKMEAKLWIFAALACVAVGHGLMISKSEMVAGTGTLKSSTFRSPAFTLRPGEAQDKYYYGVPFPKGHIALKRFDAEVVDEDGNSIPLNEVYLHHWVVVNYYDQSGQQTRYNASRILGNDGVCPSKILSQLFGLGSETRHTNTSVPEPYGIEVGNPELSPNGTEAWLLNVHAIDTRGTVDPSGCLECRCDLYNVTTDPYGRPLRDGYIGGLDCCYDGTQCQLKEGYIGESRTYYLQYTVQYMDWDESILPVKVYILDVTYAGEYCKVEYDIPSCVAGVDCVHTQEAVMDIPVGGDVVYTVAHQHAGGIGAAIYGEDGREICTSLPLYGTGTEAGNEAGYIVGMTTCYPEPGSLKVSTGEKLRVHSNYSRMTGHTGVMGLVYVLVYAGPATSII